MDRVNELKYKLKRVEDKKLDRDDRETETRRQSLDRFEVLESKVGYRQIDIWHLQIGRF